ncbi:BZ3500_MvSof-1268-A1-R1_Chr8-2g10113 [Microbotryum saponariae]|uniref:BZ3500_MvSof-1268-A1-R1_Chr8-2g10113 protein n=1 Tax=Microbotryum saponariae TaxID=289078 RepID=A0A2X0KTL5_9BASI|nr:BZ3500_MvSof-1268-A1-R1_Chr8-2g10113 [Microbotryum saponariae]SDA01811.1 BZ3501_MvSof-1269-A2-R1_Chr8-2g09864 [Microbotryum saponariae]
MAMTRSQPLLSTLRSNAGPALRSTTSRLQARPTLAAAAETRPNKWASVRCNCTTRTAPTTTSRSTGAALLAALVVATYAVVHARGSEPLAMDAAQQQDGVVAPTSSSTSSTYKDPTTSTPFPRYINSNSGARLRLVGTGVRTVSFLNVQVYTAAFYVEEKLLQRLAQVSGGWKDYSPSDLLPPFGDGQEGKGANPSGEKLIAALLDEADCAVIISPLRTTTLAHLRDGFSRALIARMKLRRVTSTWSEKDGEEALESLSRLKGLFPSRKLNKGSQLSLFYRRQRREVEFWIKEPKSNKEERLGAFDDRFLSRELFLSYFSDDAEISKELRKSTAMGFAGEPR